MDSLNNRIVLYNWIILYNRTISSLVLFIYIGVSFGVFYIICLAGFWGECAVKIKYELKFYLWRAPASVNFIQIL